MTKASEHHHQAEESREFTQDLHGALRAADEAFFTYLEEGNLYGAAESLCSKVITLRHLARKHGPTMDILALHTAEAAVEIAEAAHVSTAIMYLNLAKAQKALGHLDEAIASLHKAVEGQQTNPHPGQDRPGVLANMQELLATAELEKGDDTAYDRAVKALKDLEALKGVSGKSDIGPDEENEYNKAVWLAHGHLHIAHALRGRDRERAEKHLSKARKMIQSNDALVLSKEMLEKLEATFS